MVLTNNNKFISEEKLKLGDDEFDVVPYFNCLGYFKRFNLDDVLDIKKDKQFLHKIYFNFS